MSSYISLLEKLYEDFNQHFFNDDMITLPIVFTIQSQKKCSCYGWCTTLPAWVKGLPKDNEDEKIDPNDENIESYYEINITAEYLSTPGVAGVLLHEMCHLYDIQIGVVDCSKNGVYHNKKFRDTAETHGLEVEKDEKYGYCITELSPESKEFINSLEYYKDFSIYRLSRIKTVKKRSNKDHIYICPTCQKQIKSKDEINVRCLDCNENFMKVPEESEENEDEHQQKEQQEAEK